SDVCSSDLRKTDVITVYQLGSPPTSHERPGPKGMLTTCGSRRSSSPGMAPNSQTDLARAGCPPAPCTMIHTRVARVMIPMVTHGVMTVGLSSRYGNIR